MKRMINRNVAVSSILFLLATGTVFAGGAANPGATDAVSAGSSDTGHRNYVPIRIYRQKVQPATATLNAGDAVIWANYTEHLAQVTFPIETARKLVCKEPSNFIVEKDVLRSVPMRGNRFASVCIFTKGTYDYEVEMVDINPNSTDPRRLQGTLVIQ